jgi:[lysine-biosynthesis-protein LysW]--L-2-aminoadipate ligase
LGADPELCEITKDLEVLAIKASKAMGGGILGIDMMEDEKKGLVVHEVNNTVEFKGLSRVAKKNIPKAMVEYALNYVRK